MRVECIWRPIPFSKYDRGQITGVEGFAVERIYRNRNTGQVRFYSKQDMDGRVVMVNGTQHVFHARGRFGMLYISEKAAE